MSCINVYYSNLCNDVMVCNNNNNISREYHKWFLVSFVQYDLYEAFYDVIYHNSVAMIMCFILLVSCPSLTDPSNGMINCSLGDDEVPSYEDTCSITCNTGYELTGSETRTCQSDGSWSGSIAMCSRSEWFLFDMICIKRSMMHIVIYHNSVCAMNILKFSQRS